MYSDYVYRDGSDTIRIRIFRRPDGWWDADVFHLGSDDVETASVEAGDVWRRKADIKKRLERQFGRLISIGRVTSVTEGW